MTGGLFRAPAYTVSGKIMVGESYDSVGFTTFLGLKNANLGMAAADVTRVPILSLSPCRDRLLGAITHRDGE